MLHTKENIWLRHANTNTRLKCVRIQHIKSRQLNSDADADDDSGENFARVPPIQRMKERLIVGEFSK